MTEQEADQLLDTEPQDLPIYIDDTAQITPMELGGKIAAIKAKHGCTLVLVDYIQIMRGNEGRYPNREAEVSSISRDLKAIAKREGVHIIALAQLSRETEKRSNPQPKLSDLRESGAIEQDADNIWFIYRPEYYTETPSIDDTVEVGKTGVHVPLKGHTTIICEKFRNGPTFRAYLRSDLAKMRFFSGPEGYGHRVLTFDHNHYPELFQDQGAWQEQPQAPF
jgi:replicative DNA helicase